MGFKVKEYLNYLFEMSNIRKSKTGLPVIIWAQNGVRLQHAPIIKISQNYGDKLDPTKLFSMAITDKLTTFGNTGEISKDTIKKVFLWVKKNKQNLLDYWNGTIDTETFLNNIKTL